MAEIFLEHYMIVKKIGSGSFGEVYEAQDEQNNVYAIKIEDKTKKNKLKKEYNIYRKISDATNSTPTIYSYMETEKYNILVMELLGSNLEELFVQNNKQFDKTSVMNLGLNIIKIIEQFHKKGFIHRDIKPSNFLVDTASKNKIYMMDFGLSKKYVSNGKHMELKNIKSLIGTPRYVSTNVHDNIEPSRRDDLESIGYMLLYLYNGKLPWQGIKTSKKSSMHTTIGIMKKSISLEELTQNTPSCFYKYLYYVRNLNYDETPNYKYLTNLFNNELNVVEYNKYIWLSQST
jgi:serine/threonine protein kinase